jgi:hypothetical protein
MAEWLSPVSKSRPISTGDHQLMGSKTI